MDESFGTSEGFIKSSITSGVDRWIGIAHDGVGRMVVIGDADVDRDGTTDRQIGTIYTSEADSPEAPDDGSSDDGSSGGGSSGASSGPLSVWGLGLLFLLRLLRCESFLKGRAVRLSMGH